MTIFVRACENDLRPVRKLLEEVERTVEEVLEYYGESEKTMGAMEQLFKSITAFGKLYLIEQKRQEKAPGLSKMTPQKVKSTVAA